MNGALLTSKTGLEAQNLQLQFISNNIANAETKGYKATRPEFASLMTVSLREPSSSEGSAIGGLQVGTGVRAVGSITDFSQGQPVGTERTLDIMIQGEGFLPVITEEGDRMYTRNGALLVDEEGRLSTVDNYILDPEIVIPENTEAIEFDREGIVSVITTDDDEAIELGQIELVRFINNNGLKHIDGGFYTRTETSGDEIVGYPNQEGFGSILQNYLEGSNVNTIDQMVKMITAQRGYEMSSKAMSAANSTMQSLNNVI